MRPQSVRKYGASNNARDYRSDNTDPVYLMQFSMGLDQYQTGKRDPDSENNGGGGGSVILDRRPVTIQSAAICSRKTEGPQCIAGKCKNLLLFVFPSHKIIRSPVLIISAYVCLTMN